MLWSVRKCISTPKQSLKASVGTAQEALDEAHSEPPHSEVHSRSRTRCYENTRIRPCPSRAAHLAKDAQLAKRHDGGAGTNTGRGAEAGQKEAGTKQEDGSGRRGMGVAARRRGRHEDKQRGRGRGRGRPEGGQQLVYKLNRAALGVAATASAGANHCTRAPLLPSAAAAADVWRSSLSALGA